jgi:hypothetical protein
MITERTPTGAEGIAFEGFVPGGVVSVITFRQSRTPSCYTGSQTR